MANEKRLIDANAVLDKIRNSTASGATKVTAFVFVDMAPTVDAVEVVRCKDCKQYNGHRYCYYFAEAVLDNDFCSYGERKTDG